MDEVRAIQGVEPARVLVAETTGQYAEMVRQGSGAGRKIVDYGVAHHGLGHPPPAEHVQIDPPVGVIEHHVADMSVRVAGGTALGDLQTALAAEGQYLPMDGADTAWTVAELIAHDVFGPLRLSHGSMRDLLLGLRYVDAAGRLITVGGRTVKNVAGYDLTRLMVGNLNTLGLIAEATLRTASIPPCVSRITLGGLEPAMLDERMTGLLTSDACPWYMHWCGTGAGGGAAEPALYMAYAGTASGCDAQHAALVDWLGAQGLDVEPMRADGGLAEDAAARAERDARRRDCAALVKVVVPPADTGRMMGEMLASDPRPGVVDGLPAHGVVHIGSDWTAAEAVAVDRHLLRLLDAVGGLRLWLRRPEHSPAIPPLAPDPPDRPMIEKIEHAMASGRVFNPGRLFGNSGASSYVVRS